MQGSLSQERTQTLHLNHEKVLKGPEAFDTAVFLLGTIVIEWSREAMEHRDKAFQGKLYTMAP